MHDSANPLRAPRSWFRVLVLEILPLARMIVTSAIVAWAWRAWPPVYDSLAIFKVELSIECYARRADDHRDPGRK
ncbi:MAG: hypothetical protein U0794_16715 [Isosphaeraceae bacterium]